MIRHLKGLKWTLKGLLFLSLFLLNSSLNAQKKEPDFFHRYPTEIKRTAKDSSPARIYPMAIGISAGTQAFIAADVAINLNAKFNARLAYHQLTYTFQENNIDFNGADLLLNANFKQSNVSLFGEYMLKESLRLVVGLSFAPDNAFSINGILADSIQFQDVLASPEEIGLINGTIQMGNKVAPYFGLGLGRAIPQRRIGFSVDIGTYYKGSPKVDLVATNLLRNNVNNEKAIEDAIGFAQWWPVFSLRLAVRIN